MTILLCLILQLQINLLKDFYGDEYKDHNSCMTENQRYSKEGRAGWDPTKGSVSVLNLFNSSCSPVC